MEVEFAEPFGKFCSRWSGRSCASATVDVYGHDRPLPHQVESRRVRTVLCQLPPEIQAFIILAGPLSKSVLNPASVLLSRANRAGQTVYGHDVIIGGGWQINRGICRDRKFCGNVVDGLAKRRELTLKAMGRIKPEGSGGYGGGGSSSYAGVTTVASSW